MRYILEGFVRREQEQNSDKMTKQRSIGPIKAALTAVAFAASLGGCARDNTNVTFATAAEATAKGTYSVVKDGERYRINPIDDGNGQLVCTEMEPIYGEGRQLSQHGVGVFEVGRDPETNIATYVRVPTAEALNVARGSVCVGGKLTDGSEDRVSQ